MTKLLPITLLTLLLNLPLSLIADFSFDGGVVSLMDGSTETEICVGDGIPDPFMVMLMDEEGPKSAWVVTDELGEILAIQDGNTFDLEGAGAGTCLIWHMGYKDIVGPFEVGMNKDNVQGWLDYSNPITVVRNPIEASLISVDGETEISICVDGVPDPFDVDFTTGVGRYSTFVVTDEDLKILALTDDNTFDFDAVGPGTCIIWRLNYNNIFGNLVGLNAGNLGGCFLLSNPITVKRQVAESAAIALEDGETSMSICAGDGVSDAFTPTVTGGMGEFNAWIITDEDLNILATPPGPTFDLDGAGAGTCLLWYLSYNGEVAGISVGNNAGDLVGCLALSNAISIERDGVSGGVIELAGGGDSLDICAGDGVSDAFTVSAMGVTGSSQVWVITDEDLNILATPPGPTFDLEGAGAGTCLVWYLSFNGNISGAEVGMNAADLEGCYDLSNPITVTRDGVVGAEIATTDGLTEFSICAGDGIADPFSVDVTGGSGEANAWIITDQDLNILGLPGGPTFDLDGAGGGTCLLWYASINGMLSGVEVGANVSAIEGCYALSNPITIIREGVSGGDLMLDGGGTALSICAGDGIEDPFTPIISGATGSSSAWVITDEELNILALPGGPTFDLEGAGAGVCLLWHLSYNGEISGAEVGANAADLAGCLALSNSIAITRDGVSAAAISLDGGGTELEICAGDGISDAFTPIVEGGEGESSAWVVTDQELNILGLPDGPTFDLEGAGSGTCLLWYLNYNGDLTGVELGANAANLMGCFVLSNAITIVRNGVTAASISIDGGGTELEICAGDGVSDAFTALVEGGEGETSDWIITDQDLNILGLPDGPTFDLEGAGAGVCLVWYASINGELSGVEVGMNAGDITGCFVLSNPITVTRNGVAPSTISIDGGGDMISICAGDGISDAFTAIVEGGEGENSGWVITDESLTILALPEGPTFDLDGAGAGTCLVWNITYNGMLTGLEMGASAGDIEGCFALSNSITVERSGVEPAILTFDDGSDEVTICAGDGISDAFTPMLSESTGMNSAWVITDSDLNILALPEGPEFDLEGAGAGVCLLWYVSYNGDLEGAEVGANAGDLAGCFALSNALTINRIGVSSATIDSDLGTEITICAGDGIADPFTATVEGGQGEFTGWIITDTLGNVLGLPEGPTFDLEGAGSGVCLVWYYNAYASLEGLEVGDSVSSIETCFALSNPITVTREGVLASSIFLEGGALAQEICVGDDVPDVIVPLEEGGEGESYAWVITDSDSTIVGLPTGGAFNLEGAGPGTCLIWRLSYNGEVSNLELGLKASAIEGCAALSNAIAITRVAVDGGNLTLEDGTDEIEICAGDGTSDAFAVSLEESVGESSAWVITDEDLKILALPAEPPFDLEGAGAGVCLIWHLSYNGEISGAEVDSSAADLMGCFELSNPITVTRVTEGSLCTSGQIRPEDVDIFPNPTDGFITLGMLVRPKYQVDVQVFDAYGQLLTIRNNMNNDDMKLDVENLDAGVYYLRILHGEDQMIKEFIKL